MTFLDDVQQLGILRQAGPVYQFRHARLREQLASHAATTIAGGGGGPDPPSAAGATVGIPPSPIRLIARVAAAAVAVAVIHAGMPRPGQAVDGALRALTAGAPSEEVPLDRNDSKHSWDEVEEPDHACHFRNAAYHLQELRPGYFVHCGGRHFELGGSAVVVVFQIQMSIRGGDEGGIYLVGTNHQECLYTLNAAGGFTIQAVDNGRGKTAGSGYSRATRTGHGDQNILTVVISGTTVTFYVNGARLASSTKCGVGDYHISLMAETLSHATDVEFTHARTWYD
jgi:hypothetical protein